MPHVQRTRMKIKGQYVILHGNMSSYNVDTGVFNIVFDAIPGIVFKMMPTKVESLYSDGTNSWVHYN